MTPPFALPLEVKDYTYIYDAKDRFLFAVYTPRDGAHYIVTAVNAHAGLVEALEQIEANLNYIKTSYEKNGPQWTTPGGNQYEDTSSVLERAEINASIARAALAAAEPK